MLARRAWEEGIMARDPRYDILFEPVKIGPLTARNRFYQVPHCTGMGWALPRTLAAMRGMKAEGGWAVVNTEYCSIHPSSDDTPYPYARLWDAEDVRAQALMTEAVHRHGALAGCELWIGGNYVASLSSREPPLDLISVPARGDPVQSRRIDREDIRDIRRWHRDAARRAVEAGFDIVYVYATHGYLLNHFLSREHNPRSDEYGGSLENRLRLVRELLEETREAIGPDRALALRFTAASHRDARAEPGGYAEPGEYAEMVERLAGLPDLWDVVADDYDLEMGSSRFVKEGSLEPFVAYVRRVTGKPVVSVGRFTSPDAMAAQVRRGILDFIGAARPSIADPFLPRKIEDGRADEVRECIGCNICYSSNSRGTPLRCTQNPTMGEEWRRGWHPEKIAARGSDDPVLVVGGGPAGLEAARALGQRGYRVLLAEAGRDLGGRVSRESRLPGLAEWARVRDWRLQRLREMANVEVYLESRLDAAQVREFALPHVLIATGASWRRDGIGRRHRTPLPGFDHPAIATPDDVMAGPDALAARWPAGRVAVFDDDHYYMAAVIAEAIVKIGRAVTLVTTAGTAALWSYYTQEQQGTNRRLHELGIEIRTSLAVGAYDGERLALDCIFSGRRDWLPAAGVVTVTAREPDDGLYLALAEDAAALARAGIRSLRRIGDCHAPALIAHAVHSGHRAARELDADPATIAPRIERPML
jgi:dimethylamine/trimethylamine dehydrogenase